MPDPDRIRAKALKKLEGKGSLSSALKVVDTAMKGESLAKAPFELISARLEVLQRGGGPAEVLDFGRKALKARKQPAEREEILGQLSRLLTHGATPETVLLLWQGWAQLDRPDRAYQVSRHFPDLPDDQIRGFAERCKSLREESATEHLGLLGLAHAALARGAAAKALPPIRAMARLAGRANLKAHAADLVESVDPGTDPEALWGVTEVHLLTGAQATALETFQRLVSQSPGLAVNRINDAIADGTLSNELASRFIEAAVEAAPDSHPLRHLMVEICSADGRLQEAGEHLLFLGRTTHDSAVVEQSLGHLTEMIEESGGDLEVACMKAELLAWAGRGEELEEAAGKIMAEAPGRALQVLDQWHEAGHDALPPLEILRAYAFASLGRHPEAATAVTRLLEDPELAETLIAPLSRLWKEHPAVGTYGLLSVRAHYLAGRQNDAMEAAERLLLLPDAEAERLHDFVAENEFEPGSRAAALHLLSVSSLEIGRVEEALDHLAELAESDTDQLRGALRRALFWQEDLFGKPEWALRVASLLIRADMIKEAVEVLEAASLKHPGTAGDLALVFEEPHIAPKRNLALLRCRFSLQLRASRLESAAATAMAIGESGEWEEERRLLLMLVDREEARPFVLPRLLTTSIRLDRPGSELVRHGRALRALGEGNLSTLALSELKKRHQRVALGDEGLELLGLLALDLECHEESAEHFLELAKSAPFPAKAGLRKVLESRPELDEVRSSLVELCRGAGEFDDALELLAAAPERTAALLASLVELSAVEPPHVASWWVLAEWLEEREEWERLVAHFAKLADVDGADLERIDHVLERIAGSAEPTLALLWLRARIARRVGEVRREVEQLGRIFAHGGDEIDAVFREIDALRGSHPDDPDLVTDALGFALEARRLPRLTALAREVVDRPPLAEMRAPVAERLKAAEDLPRHDREYDRALFDLGLSVEDRELGHRAWQSLIAHDRKKAEPRVGWCSRFRKRFGPDADHLEEEISSLVLAGRAEDAVELIRVLAAIPVEESGGEAPFERARRLAGEAAAAAPESVSVRLAASDLAAEAGEPAAALDHALAPLTEDTGEEVRSQLTKLKDRFEKEAAFDLALALRLFEPAEAREAAADHLWSALLREPKKAKEVHEAAGRLLAAEPACHPALRVRARAAVIRASSGAKAADTAVTDLRAYAEGVSDSHAEVLGWLDEVLADRPRHLEGRFLREEMLRSLSRPEEAAEDIRSEILLDGLDEQSEFRARFRLADALEEIREFGAALDEWRRCLEIDPTDETVPERVRRNFQGWRVREFKDAGEDAMKRGVLAMWAGEPDTALSAVPRPPDGDGENLPALAVRGAALLGLGRPVQVREELEPALGSIPLEGELDLFQREFLYALGTACLALEEEGVALRCLERLAREAPEHRSVRRVLDHAYARKALGAERPFELTSTLEGIDGE